MGCGATPCDARRAGLFDFMSLACAFLSVVVGLAMTLGLLAVFKQALPALPISIALGVISYAMTRGALLPMAAEILAASPGAVV